MGGAATQDNGMVMLLAGFLIGGIVMTVVGVWWYRRGSGRFATASARWMKSEATIETSRIQVSHHFTGDTSSVTYRPIASYRYQAGGGERSGSRVFLCVRTDWNSERERQAAGLRRIPQGRPCRCGSTQPDRTTRRWCSTNPACSPRAW